MLFIEYLLSASLVNSGSKQSLYVVRSGDPIFVFVMSSAAVSRVPVVGLEGESGLRRAQPHSAGEQEAGQGPGEPVT